MIIPAEITVKMISCKYVLSCGCHLDVWNIAMSASSWCFWLPLPHMSCLYSCAYIHSCSDAVWVRKTSDLSKAQPHMIFIPGRLGKHVDNCHIPSALYIFHPSPMRSCTSVSRSNFPSIYFKSESIFSINKTNFVHLFAWLYNLYQKVIF